jgi:hypothetical protein
MSDHLSKTSLRKIGKERSKFKREILLDSLNDKNPLYLTKCSPGSFICSAITGDILTYDGDNMTVGRYAPFFFRVSYSNGSCNENKHHAYFTDAESYEDHSNTTLSNEIKEKWRIKCAQLIVNEEVEKEIAVTAVDYAFRPVPWSLIV